MHEISFIQMNSLLEKKYSIFIEKLRKFVREGLDASLSNTSEQDLQLRVRELVDIGRASNLSAENDIALYVFAGVAIGSDFPSTLPLIHRMLTDTAVDHKIRRSELAGLLEVAKR